VEGSSSGCGNSLSCRFAEAAAVSCSTIMRKQMVFSTFSGQGNTSFRQRNKSRSCWVAGFSCRGCPSTSCSAAAVFYLALLQTNNSATRNAQCSCLPGSALVLGICCTSTDSIATCSTAAAAVAASVTAAATMLCQSSTLTAFPSIASDDF
jgi:hypothetical protein